MTVGVAEVYASAAFGPGDSALDFNTMRAQMRFPFGQLCGVHGKTDMYRAGTVVRWDGSAGKFRGSVRRAVDKEQ